jgi:glycine betaine/choline ABC-type transport system substrate-binding protein
MKRRLFASSIMAIALSTGFVATPALADSGDVTFEMIWKMASKDGMVSKKDFMDAMGKAYDMKMEKMKAMKDGSKMMKGDAMTREGFKSFIDDVHKGA